MVCWMMWWDRRRFGSRYRLRTRHSKKWRQSVSLIGNPIRANRNLPLPAPIFPNTLKNRRNPPVPRRILAFVAHKCRTLVHLMLHQRSLIVQKIVSETVAHECHTNGLFEGCGCVGRFKQLGACPFAQDETGQVQHIRLRKLLRTALQVDTLSHMIQRSHYANHP
jgi:hypothetical protein